MNDDRLLVRVVVITGTIVSALISLIVVTTVAYSKVIHPEFETPEVLTNWGGLIIGFYFGSFLSMIRIRPGTAQTGRAEVG